MGPSPWLPLLPSPFLTPLILNDMRIIHKFTVQYAHSHCQKFSLPNLDKCFYYHFCTIKIIFYHHPYFCYHFRVPGIKAEILGPQVLGRINACSQLHQVTMIMARQRDMRCDAWQARGTHTHTTSVAATLGWRDVWSSTRPLALCTTHLFQGQRLCARLLYRSFSEVNCPYVLGQGFLQGQHDIHQTDNKQQHAWLMCAQ